MDNTLFAPVAGSPPESLPLGRVNTTPLTDGSPQSGGNRTPNAKPQGRRSEVVSLEARVAELEGLLAKFSKGSGMPEGTVTVEAFKVMEARAVAAEARVEALTKEVGVLRRVLTTSRTGVNDASAAEPICNEEEGLSKYVAFEVPRVRPCKIWDLYEKMVRSFWTFSEIDLAEDIREWNRVYNPVTKKGLTSDEKHFIKHVLAFFATSEGVVIENAATNLFSMVQWADFRQFYAFQVGNEAVHAQTYAGIIDTLVKDKTEKLMLFNAIEELECVRTKAAWAQKHLVGEAVPNPTNASEYMVDSEGVVVRSPPRVAECIAAFAAVEGIFFSGSFCAVFWLKKRGKMPGLCFSNELISRDEGIHLDAAVEAYKQLEAPLTQKEIHEMYRGAVDEEKKFVCGALPVELIGMNSSLMSRYIEYVADYVLNLLGYDDLFGTANPFDWMEMISVEGKTNFFEKRVGEYAKTQSSEATTGFVLDDDF